MLERIIKLLFNHQNTNILVQEEIVGLIKDNHPAAVSILLEAGAVDMLVDGQYLIHRAAQDGHFEMVKLLLDKKPGFLNKTDALGQTALWHAKNRGHIAIAQFLIALEADLNSRTKHTEKTGLKTSVLPLSIFHSEHSFLADEITDEEMAESAFGQGSNRAKMAYKPSDFGL